MADGDMHFLDMVGAVRRHADAKIGLGVMYQKDAPTFEDAWPAPPPLTDAQRAAWVAGVMDERS